MASVQVAREARATRGVSQRACGLTLAAMARIVPAMTRLAIVLSAALAGCGGYIDRQAADATYRVVEAAQRAAAEEADVELARDALPGGLFQLAGFARAYPAHPGFAALYGDAICQYAAGFVFDDWEDATLAKRSDDAARIAARLSGLLARCRAASLARLPWAATAKSPAEVAALLPRATRDDAPALLWLATAWTTALALEPLAHVFELPAIQATLERCATLAPGGRDASAELLLGTLAAGRAQVLGGDAGDAWFEAARKRAGEGALLVDVMYARGVAVARKDRAGFRAALERALAADVARWPARRLANALAQRKARRYLAAEAALLP